MAQLPIHKLVDQLQNQPIIFVGGKGGVGKTTMAAALASRFARMGQKTLIVSTDPAHSLGDVLDANLDHQKTAITPYLDATELNTDIIVDAHFRQTMRTISAYANPDMLPKIREHLAVSKSAPGAIEAAMLESLCTHLIEAAASGYDHIIFDTAPTGHTLRLLMLPEMMSAWTDGLLAQQRRQAKLRKAADHLGGTGNKIKKDIGNPFKATKPDRWAQAVAVLEARKALFKKAGALIYDPDKTAIVLVMTADVLPLAETRRAVQTLTASKLTPAAIVVNQLIDKQQTDPFWSKRAERQQQLIEQIHTAFLPYPLYGMYLQQTDIRGERALAALMSR